MDAPAIIGRLRARVCAATVSAEQAQSDCLAFHGHVVWVQTLANFGEFISGAPPHPPATGAASRARPVSLMSRSAVSLEQRVMAAHLPLVSLLRNHRAGAEMEAVNWIEILSFHTFRGAP